MDPQTILLASKILLQVVGRVNNMVLIREFQEANEKYIKKIDALDEKLDSAILMDLKAMQKCFKDFQKAEAFTSSNLEYIQNTFRKYLGLPLKGTTGGVENRKIVANSYLGLIVIEKMSENPNQILIARYIFHMFEASPGSGKRSFPAIHEKFFQSICDKIAEQVVMDLKFTEWYRSHWADAGMAELKHLCEILKKYDVSFDITDWKKGATSIPGKAAGALANKTIGPVHIDFSTIIKITEYVRRVSSSVMTQCIMGTVLDRVIYTLKMKMPKYQEDMIFRKVRKAAGEYLKTIDKAHVTYLPSAQTSALR